MENEVIKSKNVHIDRPIITLPNVCIHLREAKDRDCMTLDKERHLKPFLSLKRDDFDNKYTELYLNKQWKELLDAICKESNIDVNNFVNLDLNLVDAHKPSLSGLNNEFVNSARIDNQVTCYSIIRALVETSEHQEQDGVSMAALFDNEEIGSQTTQGANSLIQKTTIDRILACTGLVDTEL